MKLDFGKYKGNLISECETKYLKWLISHEKQLKLSHRWAARDARFEMARREQKVAKVEEQIEAEQAIAEAELILAEQREFAEWAETRKARKPLNKKSIML
jgi:hypothetical protein